MIKESKKSFNNLIKNLVYLVFMAAFASCSMENEGERHLLPSKNYHYTDINFNQLNKIEKVYVPIYSDIYSRDGSRKFLMTSTLSIRNTSLSDSMYVKNVDYFDSEGQLLRNYLKKSIFLTPLQSVEFVVEFDEIKGGPGANFIVTWGSDNKLFQPIIQAIMIGQSSSFITDGVTMQ